MFDSGKGPKEPCFFSVAQFVSLRSCRFRGYLLHASSFVLPAGTGCHWLVIRYKSWLCVVAARFTWFTAKSWCCSALLISDQTTILVFVFELISCPGLFLHTSPPPPPPPAGGRAQAHEQVDEFKPCWKWGYWVRRRNL
jgi:hypothetical protein